MRLRTSWSLLLLLLCACNTNSTRNRVLVAERLLEDKKYDAAVLEYQTVVNREPFTELGRSSLLKIAQIQHLYLGRARDAEDSYQRLFKRTKDERLKAEIEQALANIAFENLEEYGTAIDRYQQILARDPGHPQADLFLYNIGRAYFLESKLPEAAKVFESFRAKYPSSNLIPKVDQELANILAASGKCREAIRAYDKIIARKDERQTPLAIFAKATCFEEMDDLDAAYELFTSIKSTYPFPAVIELKLKKLKRRKILRRR